MLHILSGSLFVCLAEFYSRIVRIKHPRCVCPAAPCSLTPPLIVGAEHAEFVGKYHRLDGIRMPNAVQATEAINHVNHHARLHSCELWDLGL